MTHPPSFPGGIACQLGAQPCVAGSLVPIHVAAPRPLGLPYSMVAMARFR